MPNCEFAQGNGICPAAWQLDELLWSLRNEHTCLFCRFESAANCAVCPW